MTTAKRSLADLTAAFASKTESSAGNADWKKYFPFWKGAVDSVSTVRFLPDADEANGMGFLVENLTHELTINGKREKIACGKMYGESCPICELSARYYDEKGPDHNEELGKAFYRKKSYIGQVLVIETPVEHDASQIVKLVDFGPQVFKQIMAAFQSGDLENPPYELKGGYNFRFRKTQTGSGQNSYTTSNFSPKQTDVADDVIEKMDLYNLADYRAPKMDRATMELMLVAAQTGGTYSVGAEKETAGIAAKSTLAESAVSTPTPPAEAALAAPAKLSVVEQLRARAAAAKAAQAATT